MHERQIYHGKLHGENVLIRNVDNEEKLCLVDYAYSNLCTRDAITHLVNGSPSFCGKKKNGNKFEIVFFLFPSSGNITWRTIFLLIGYVAIRNLDFLLVRLSKKLLISIH